MSPPSHTICSPPWMSRRRSVVVCAAVLASLSSAFVARAAAEPAYAVQARTDRADAKYAVGDTVVFTVECLADGKPVPEATLNYSLRENDFKQIAQGSVAITDGRGTIKHTWTRPGFLLLTITQPGVKKPVLVGAACDPEKLQPSMPTPDDFDAFWEGMKAKVDSIAADPVLTPVPQLTDDAIETYALTMENINGTKVRCYFSKPRGEGPFPAYMELHGAGTMFIEPDLVARYARRGVMAIDMCPHDVELGQPEATYRELWNSTLKGYPRRGSDSRDTSYFLQMFCGNYRTARYITSRPEWDRSHFVVHGSSQGGGQCLATAYLCPQVTALAANIAALCDHTGPAAGRAAGWPKWITYADGTPDPDQLAAARYFDGVNFAQSIEAKGLMSMGFIDQVCPPSAVYTAFNAFKGPKQVLEKPLVAHQLSPLWRDVSQKFIEQELGLPSGPAGAVAAEAAPSEAAAVPSPIPAPVSLRPQGVQTDFPAITVDAAGRPWLVSVEWDGTQDTLVLSKHVDGRLERVCAVGRPGIIHQPAIAADATGGIVVVWSQVNDKDLMDLKTQRFRDGRPDGEEVTLAASADGGNGFACAATDRKGRVWVAWQSLRGGFSDVFCRWFDPAAARWSSEVRVTRDPAGDWEPCLAFDGQDGAWVVYDSSRGNEFNIEAVRVGLDGSVGETKMLIRTDRYEARASAVGTADGTGIWLACERGNVEWGLDCRGHKGPAGLNGNRNTVFARWDLASGRVEELPAIDPFLDFVPPPVPNTDRPKPRGNSQHAQAKAEARDQQRTEGEAGAREKDAEPKKPKRRPPDTINLPQLAVDGSGRPWMTVRYFKDYCWQIAVARFDADANRWTEPVVLPASGYSQDKRTSAALGPDGSLWLAWAGDQRTSKVHRTSGVEIVRLPEDLPLPLAEPRPLKPFAPPPPSINPVTPERLRDDRHSWTHDGTIYRLYWGDFHRHTDISPCRTAHDGCVLEQFRYALDMGKLDVLGTSDHTDNKIYHAYEWWLNQKMVDVFFVPGFFNSMYAYEREQPWPNGHRNVIFAERGGPIVYIHRVNYLQSPWRATLPLRADGPATISPQELWDVLGRYGKPVTVMSHTGATGMGTDWNRFDRIDHRVENVIEIFQGARVAYEGQNAPQPTVGLRRGEQYTADTKTIGTPQPGEPIRGFTGKENGLYQNALARGHKLGVWANSDHISTHTSFGGVYVKDFTREGIIEGINARRTIAATDKIFVEFTCNDRLLGTEVEVTGQPALAWKIDGTAEVKQVTLVRNEENYRQWQPGSRTVAESFIDESPLAGENRYYLRIEQSDGNMAWSSPVWVNVKQP